MNNNCYIKFINITLYYFIILYYITLYITSYITFILLINHNLFKDNNGKVTLKRSRLATRQL